MLDKITLSSSFDSNTAIVVLPGRGQSGFQLARRYQEIVVGPVIVGLTPENYEWYPIPKGPEDQDEALSGIEKSIEDIEEVLFDIEREFGVTKDGVALVGHSAGAVMAIRTALKGNDVFAAVISHNGVVLDPENIPKCKKPEMPFLFLHNEDDTVFSFDDRYLPTKTAMKKKKYNFSSVERKNGGHGIAKKDVAYAHSFMAKAHRFSTEWGRRQTREHEKNMESINKDNELY